MSGPVFGASGNPFPSDHGTFGYDDPEWDDAWKAALKRMAHYRYPRATADDYRWAAFKVTALVIAIWAAIKMLRYR